jgi:hypothetical protein
VIEAASASLVVTVTAAGVRDADEIESTIKAFAQEPSGGLIVAPSPITTIQRELIIALAARLNLPAIYPFRYFPKSGAVSGPEQSGTAGEKPTAPIAQSRTQKRGASSGPLT